MATLANLFNRFVEAGRVAEAAVETASSENWERYRIRSLPNEDVYFYFKRLDNSRVVPLADPRARTKSWKFLGASVLSAAFLICMLLPTAYGYLAGRQLHDLQQENQRLVTERGRLELEEEKLVSPAALSRYAETQNFEAPAPQRVVYLTPKDDVSFAKLR